MSRPLRVLLLEDSHDDARLIRDELSRAGFEPIGERVETESEFPVQLDLALDIIVVDHCLPQFEALRALDLLRERGLDVPGVMITGFLDAEALRTANRRKDEFLGTLSHKLRTP